MIPLALDAFGHDPTWVVILKAVLIFVVLVLLTLFNIWWERRVVARMQHRIGPNVNGPFGLIVDAVSRPASTSAQPVTAQPKRHAAFSARNSLAYDFGLSCASAERGRNRALASAVLLG